MSVNIEQLGEIYPEWKQHMHPLTVILMTITAIVLFTLISYLHIYFSAKYKSKLETSELKYECDCCGETFDELRKFCPYCGIEFDIIEMPTDLNEFEGRSFQPH